MWLDIGGWSVLNTKRQCGEKQGNKKNEKEMGSGALESQDSHPTSLRIVATRVRGLDGGGGRGAFGGGGENEVGVYGVLFE